MNIILKLLKYEIKNVIRSRWVIVYTAALLFLSVVFLYLAGSSGKALVTVSTVITVLVPLTCILFTTFYWYNSDRLTELLVTQPINRGAVVCSRFLALSLSLGVGFFLGVVLPFLLSGQLALHLLWVSFFGGFLAVVFCGLGILIGVLVPDRMRGVGLAFATWLYFVVLHDMLVLILLILLKEFPMDLAASVLASVNPIGLTRVILLVLQDAAMLLGHSGAMVRELMLGMRGWILAGLIVTFWTLVPILVAWRGFNRRDL